jgi:hypothetical protein
MQSDIVHKHMFDWADMICNVATGTWDFIGYIYRYIDETDFKF